MPAKKKVKKSQTGNQAVPVVSSISGDNWPTPETVQAEFVTDAAELVQETAPAPPDDINFSTGENGRRRSTAADAGNGSDQPDAPRLDGSMMMSLRGPIDLFLKRFNRAILTDPEAEALSAALAGVANKHMPMVGAYQEETALLAVVGLIMTARLRPIIPPVPAPAP